MKVNTCPLCNGYSKLEKKSKTVINGFTDYVTYCRCTQCDCRGPRVRLADFDNPTDARQLAVDKWNNRVFDVPDNRNNITLITLVRYPEDAPPLVDNFYIALGKNELNEDPEKILRKKIRNYLASNQGWEWICDTDYEYNWNHFISDMPEMVVVKNRQTDDRILGDTIVEVNESEPLVPDNVEGTCYAYFGSERKRALCEVDFTTGNVFLKEPIENIENANHVGVLIKNEFGKSWFELDPDGRFEFLEKV